MRGINRMVRFVAVLLALVVGMGCASAQVGLFQRGAAKPDQSVVESFLRFKEPEKAKEYLLRLGLTEAEILARVQQAREKVSKESAQ